MSLEKGIEKKKEVRVSVKEIRWNGEDFRGYQCRPKAVRFVCQHPLVYAWLKNKPRSSISLGAYALDDLCKFIGLTPEEFLTLDKKEARKRVWEYLDSFRMNQTSKAKTYQAMIKSFYLYHNEERLEFIRGKHDIVGEPKKIKHIMSKEVCWKVIHKAKNLRDECILKFAFESGLRRNAVIHLTFNHYKNFIWFKKTEDGVAPSNETEGNIAVFRVVARKHRDFVDDDKLRGKGINWYYGCLHEEATGALKEYVEKYHNDPEGPLFLFFPRRRKDKAMGERRLLGIVKDCVERAGLPVDQINFHAFRRGFRHVVRNTAAITDSEFKEAIMGHKLKGSQEAYFGKDPNEFAREYAKCDFSPPHAIKDKVLAKRDKEIEELKRHLLQLQQDKEMEKLKRQVAQLRK